MGRSYWFECARCGYRAKVSGREDRGLHLFVQTILCRDCKELYDAVTRLRLPQAQPVMAGEGSLLQRARWANERRVPASPPTFQAALNRLTYAGLGRSRWVHYRLQCPVSSTHRVERWEEPDKCPRCGGLFLERNVLPYRIWE